jgi:16S rRNA (guanine527-N7)-methyltransferase
VHVSRETEVVDPALVAEWFGAAADRAYAYVDLLCSEGVRRGLIGPREVPRIWSRHVLNCVVLHPLIRSDRSVADLGSGAGLPGVVLALARPDLEVTLIEPLLRRTRFLEQASAELDLLNVVVVRSRGEQLAATCAFDVVVARAVAPLDRLAGWALPLCRPGGELIAVKGTSAPTELATARSSLVRLGAEDARIELCGVGVVEPPTTVVRIKSHGPTPT